MGAIRYNKKLIAATVLVTSLLGALLFHYLTGHTRHTENAYINADVVNVAAQVSGRVTGVYVKENQAVHQGDALFDIDPQPYAIALERAQAALATALQSSRQDQAEVLVARAQLAQAETDLANARGNYERETKLASRHYISQQSSDDAHTLLQGYQAKLDQARAKLNKALAVPVDPMLRGDVLQARAAIDQARLDLAHTHVSAPHDGVISNLSLSAGSLVAIGQPLFALIEDDSYYIDANFKETELHGIHQGQKVDIRIDMYPDTRFQGVVESLSGGTGTAFSLLPPQNATGNWVKIAQRVPVRIRFTHTDAEHPLRIGATASVSVQLR